MVSLIYSIRVKLRELYASIHLNHIHHPMQCILLTCILITVAMSGCHHSDERLVIGRVALTAAGESSLSAAIARNQEQPWRLLFNLSQGYNGKSDCAGRVAVFLRNDDQLPLTIALGKGKGDLTISPSDSSQIFAGTYDELFQTGRTDVQEMTVLTSKDRKVNATFKFVHDWKGENLEIVVSAWILHYGP